MATARRLFTVCTTSLVMGLLCAAYSNAQVNQESIAGLWLMDEGSGTVARDDSGHGYHADLKGNPAWVKGKFGRALEFDGGSYLEIRNSARDLAFGGVAPFSATAWVKNQSGGILISKFNAGVIGAYIVSVGGGGTISFHREVAPWAYSGTKPLPNSDWGHAAVTYDGTKMRIYVNGVFDAEQDRGAHNTDTATPVLIGAQLDHGAPSGFFRGVLDEVALFNVALTEDQIKTIMKGLATTEARDPAPVDGTTDVARDPSLSWTPTATAATHNVYFGASQDDVKAASVEAPGSILVSKGQTGTTFKPADLLEYGKTYYWRVDEVNAAPDNTVFRGKVWSFTVEPYAYPVTGITATASSFEKSTTGPANTIDGSGLTGDGHGTNGTTMWNTAMSDPGPVWIQYQFDNAYKLSEMWVWNYNGDFEPVLGFGFKDVKIEYSTDGATWTLLKEAQFAKATAAAGYTHNTTVDMGGVVAQYVKLTAKSNWSEVGIKQYGLSEVRFFQIPAQARGPQPAAAATGVGVDSTLDWRSGRDMTSEQVYFGAEKEAVANGTVAARTVTSHGFDPGALNFGTTYYWRVDEVGTATYPGALWSFTTQEYAPVDDFESYTDDEGGRIYEMWVDGWTNGTGSVVGYLQAPFAETKVVHGGSQAMPLEYNNVKTPYYSETQRTFDTPQDWTGSGADTLSLWFKGNAAKFVETSPGQYKVSSNSGDVWGTADNFRFVYQQLNGDGSISAKIVAIADATANWAKAGVMIRRSLDENAAFAFMFPTPDGRRAFQNRPTVGGSAVSAHSNPGMITFPLWVKIERKGNLFTASYSTDGKTWTVQPATENTGTDKSPNPQTISMASTVYIGMAVTSNNAGAAACTGQFSDVVTTGTVTGQWAVADVGPNPANDPAGLYVVVEDKAGKSKMVVHPDPAATTLSTWTQWRIAFSDLTGINLAAVKKLTVGAGDKANPKAGGAGMLYIDDIGFGHPAQ
ncbi:MAG: discoidin domain-containing protein [Planctomycetes bacterium]|nr:discoidin domain-containing protein [Planctomycetota bacterium]